MSTTEKKGKGLLSSLKSAFTRKREDVEGAEHPGAEAGASPTIAAIRTKTELDTSSSEPLSPMAVPQAKAGKGFLSEQLYGSEPVPKVEHDGQALQGERVAMLKINDDHLTAFNAADGMLMISPFLPEALQGVTWKISEFLTVKNLYSTKTSKVYHVVHQASNTQLALKCYGKEHMMDLQKIQAVREIWFHSHLSHPNIISMYAAWMEKGQICLAIEYAPIGSAFRKLRKLGTFPESMSAKYIVYQILCALGFLHEMGLIHRDIKPENILLTADGCKLADLGLVINHREEAANTCLGTFDYMAPELFQLPRKSHPMQFKDDPDVKTCDEKVDVWAVGVLVYELVYGAAPFAAKNTMQTVNLIMKGFSGNFPTEGAGLSTAGKDFVTQTLRMQPSERPTIKELLAHPWITAHCKRTANVESLGQMSITEKKGNTGWLQMLKNINDAPASPAEAQT